MKLDPKDIVTIAATVASANNKAVAIDKETATIVPTPGPNHALPPLNPFAARSTYALLLTVILTYCNAYGIDLFAFTTALGLGGTEQEVLDNGDKVKDAVQLLFNLGAAAWLWFERRAPNFRLSFRKT